MSTSHSSAKSHHSNSLPSTEETYLYTPVPAHPNHVSVGLYYPADRNIAMSSLGYLTLYKQLDINPHIHVERVYTDTLQQYNASQFDAIGFSFSFELDIVAILKTFQQQGIPLYQAQRGEEIPLVFAGGPTVMTNPEPFADFFDFFLIGEGEDLLDETLRLMQELKESGATRAETLLTLAQKVQGCYVPSLYEVTYTSTQGEIQAITPKKEGVPFPVRKRFQSKETMASTVASSPILTEDTIFGRTFLVEVMRGCSHRCRFCMASYAMLPTRGSNLDTITQAIESGLKHTSNIGLLGALIADHPQFGELCDFLHTQMDHNDAIQLSSAAVRVDTLTKRMAETFVRGGQRKLTVAIESGSETLRRRINKNLKQEKIFTCADTVQQAGLKGLKLYGMVGLPDETDEDIDATIQLLRALKKENPKLELVFGSSSFVPKGGTPFQWMPRQDKKRVDAKFKTLNKGLLKVAKFRPSSAKWDDFQAFISRGDRRLAPLLVRFVELGGTLGALKRAYKELKQEGVAHFPDHDWYALRERSEHEILPWDVIHLGVDKHILWKESLNPLNPRKVK